MNKTVSVFLLALMALASCEKKQETTGEKKDSASAEVKKPKVTLVHKWSSDSTLKTNESVLVDPATKTLFVSNIDGDPLKKDNNGFISKLDYDGKITKLKWVTGLSAPKGMAILNGKLYVTDISALVEIDTAKGTIIKRYEVPGAKFLNDVAVFADTIYFTDSQTNKIHTWKDGKVNEWKVADSLKGPNGLFGKDGVLYLTSMGSLDLKAIDAKTREVKVLGTGIGMGDGLVSTGKDDEFIVSNWAGQLFLVKDGKAELLLDTQDKKENSADIGYIEDQKLILVPTFFKNRVDAYELKED